MIILSIFRFCDGLEFGLFSNTFSCLFSYVDFALCYFEYLCLLFKFEFEFEKIILFDAKYIINILMKVAKKIFSGFEDRFCLFPSFLLLHLQNNSIDSNIN